MKKTIFLVAAISLGSTLSFAGEVGSTTTFASGTPALASEVNGNFTALISAINDNATRIAALEAAAPDNSVAGSTYQVHTINSSVAAGSGANGGPNNNGYESGGGNDFVNISVGSLASVFVFAADGFSFSDTVEAGADQEFEVNVPFNKFTDFSDNPLENVSATYSQTGSSITVTFPAEGQDPEEVLQLTVSEDGSLIFGAVVEKGSETFNDGSAGETSFVEMFIGVRTATSQ